jgi:hypothetical protein
MKLSGMASRFKKRQAIHVRSEHDVQTHLGTAIVQFSESSSENQVIYSESEPILYRLVRRPSERNCYTSTGHLPYGQRSMHYNWAIATHTHNTYTWRYKIQLWGGELGEDSIVAGHNNDSPSKCFGGQKQASPDSYPLYTPEGSAF